MSTRSKSSKSSRKRSSAERNQRMSDQSAVTGQSKSYRSRQDSAESRRPRFPSKAVIEYPKLKVRPRPSQPPEPTQPNVTATVVRGKDQLLISICRKPEQCLVEPDKIDTSTSPFVNVITLTKDEALEQEIEKALEESRVQRTPLSCFSPPKWTVLDDKKVSFQPAGPASAPPAVAAMVLKPARKAASPPKPTVNDGANKVEVEDETGSKQPSAKSPTGGKATGDPKQKRLIIEGSETERELLHAKWRGDDEAARSLIEKYIPGTQAAKKVEEVWPPVKPVIIDENRETYEMLSEQLTEADRLAEFPERRREKRLWKVPSPVSYRGSLNYNRTEPAGKSDGAKSASASRTQVEPPKESVSIQLAPQSRSSSRRGLASRQSVNVRGGVVAEGAPEQEAEASAENPE